jgi:phosphoglycerate dehydrogenase-like enzyme
MTKIVMLQGTDQRNRVFTASQLDQLRGYGELVLNEESGPPSKERVSQLITGADIAITSWGVPALMEEVLENAPNLRVMLHAAGSIKGIATPELWNRGIRVTNGALALGKGVAETALGMTIASLKNMWRMAQHTRDGGWTRSSVRELYQVSIGVIGSGSAGGHYIKLLQNFDVNICVYDPILSREAAQKLGAQKMELEELLAHVDVVSIHAPLLPETDKMFNQARLALMKDDCILINTARGALIDEEALIAELRKGRLFACLDVTEPEPPAVDHPFRSLPNVVLTPHIAGAVSNGLHRLAQYIIEDMVLFLDGKRMNGEVTADQLSILA